MVFIVEYLTSKIERSQKSRLMLSSKEGRNPRLILAALENGNSDSWNGDWYDFSKNGTWTFVQHNRIKFDKYTAVTTCHKILSRLWSLLLSCPELITVIPYSLVVLSSSFTNFKKFRTTLQGSSVELWSHISCPSHSSLASCWTKNWIQIASSCLQICKRRWSIMSVWPPEVLHSFLIASLFLWHRSPSHSFIPSEILWTIQILVSGLWSIEISPNLTPSFQLYISLQICSKDASFPIPVAFSSWHCDRCMCVGWGERERERVCR